MGVTGRIAQVLRGVDRLVSRIGLAVYEGQSRIIGLFFHGLVRTAAERHPVVGNQLFTVDEFRTAVRHFKTRGYRFISPEDLLAGLDPAGRYVMLSFDDGYFNNVLALDVLREFDAPATFFISTAHVRQQKAFWWDALRRRRAALGMPDAEIDAEGAKLVQMRTVEAEEHVRRAFGNDSLSPEGDQDRPFLPAELGDFARQPYVFLGSHTRDHAILTNYPLAEAREQIEGAQEDLDEMTGRRPLSIAYPNGRYDAELCQISRAAGLQVGLTTRAECQRLPLDLNSTDAMRLGRFLLKHDVPIDQQCQAIRAPFSLYRAGQRMMARLRGRAHEAEAGAKACPSGGRG